MATKFQNKYRNESARWQNWDYADPGAYFITIVTKNRIDFFGEIKSGKMVLNSTGEIAQDCWLQIPDHFFGVELGEFIIMPNHIHGIIIINERPYWGGVNRGSRDSIYQFDTIKSNDRISNNSNEFPVHIIPPGHWPSDQYSIDDHNASRNNFTINPGKERFRNQGKNTISAMVGSFKSAVSRLSRKNVSRFGWQARFHDHVIRSQFEFDCISSYIKNNPQEWERKKKLC
jgi:putative transposase